MFGGRGRKKVEDDRGADMPEPNKGLPDSDTGSGLCPRCGTLSSFEVQGNAPLTFDGGTSQSFDGKVERTFTDRVSILLCRHCHQGIVVIEEEWIGDHPEREGVRTGGTVRWKGINWWPLPGGDAMPDVPEKISRAFSEAVRTLHARCLASSAVMARRTLEAVADDRGIPTGTLKQRIDELGKRGVLHPSLSEWVTHVRLVGNTGAHFDPIDEVSEVDAKALVNFVRELLKYMYELPAELARRRGPPPAPKP